MARSKLQLDLRTLVLDCPKARAEVTSNTTIKVKRRPLIKSVHDACSSTSLKAFCPF